MVIPSKIPRQQIVGGGFLFYDCQWVLFMPGNFLATFISFYPKAAFINI